MCVCVCVCVYPCHFLFGQAYLFPFVHVLRDVDPCTPNISVIFFYFLELAVFDFQILLHVFNSSCLWKFSLTCFLQRSADFPRKQTWPASVLLYGQFYSSLLNLEAFKVRENEASCNKIVTKAWNVASILRPQSLILQLTCSFSWELHSTNIYWMSVLCEEWF